VPSDFKSIDKINMIFFGGIIRQYIHVVYHGIKAHTTLGSVWG